MLTTEVSINEIFKAVKQINPQNASSLNGMQAVFNNKSQNIVSKSVYKMLNLFIFSCFTYGHMLKNSIGYTLSFFTRLIIQIAFIIIDLLVFVIHNKNYIKCFGKRLKKVIPNIISHLQGILFRVEISMIIFLLLMKSLIHFKKTIRTRIYGN